MISGGFANGTSSSYGYDAAGQLTSDSTGTTYNYDAAGNMVGRRLATPTAMTRGVT